MKPRAFLLEHQYDNDPRTWGNHATGHQKLLFSTRAGALQFVAARVRKMLPTYVKGRIGSYNDDDHKKRIAKWLPRVEHALKNHHWAKLPALFEALTDGSERFELTQMTIRGETA